MKAALIAAVMFVVASCATDQPRLPLTSGAAAQPEEPERPLVCRFGDASNDKLGEKEKHCTTLKEREEAKDADTKDESNPQR